MSSDTAILRDPVDCADCGATHPLEDWIEADDDCPSCGTAHVVPRLPAARRALEQGDFDGGTLTDVADGFGLEGGDVVDLLLAVRCDPAGALDVARVAIGGRPRSEWRRWIGETREQELENVARVERVLEEHGVAVDYPEE